TNCTGGSIGDLPTLFKVALAQGFQFRTGCQIGFLEATAAQLAGRSLEQFGKGHTAHRGTFQNTRFVVHANNELGAAPADIHYQTLAVIVGGGVGEPGIDKARFLETGNDLDRQTENLFGRFEELPGLPGTAQGLGGYRTDMMPGNMTQA